MKLATRHFVRPEHMNHHQSLYAGCLSEWVTEAAFIGMAGVLGRTDHVVLASIKEINITKSVYTGMILELHVGVENIGTTSVELKIQGQDYLTGEGHCEGRVVFVTVDDEGRKSPHYLSGSAKD